MYLVLSSFISKRSLGLDSSWEAAEHNALTHPCVAHLCVASMQRAFLQALYFSVVTLTTIGLGDLVPQTPAAKWIVSLLCLVGVPIFGDLAWLNSIGGLKSPHEAQLSSKKSNSYTAQTVVEYRARFEPFSSRYEMWQGGTLAELVALIYGERQRGIKQRQGGSLC